jgi:hypothetical protein
MWVDGLFDAGIGIGNQAVLDNHASLSLSVSLTGLRCCTRIMDYTLGTLRMGLVSASFLGVLLRPVHFQHQILPA